MVCSFGIILNLFLEDTTNSPSSMGYPKAIFVQILVISVIAVAVRSEVFSALATLTKALYNEKELAASMRKYVELEKERLDNVLK